jgi:hypothetical protein
MRAPKRAVEVSARGEHEVLWRLAAAADVDLWTTRGLWTTPAAFRCDDLASPLDRDGPGSEEET